VLLLKVRGINNGDVKQAVRLSVMPKIIYYLHKPVGEVAVLSSQGLGRNTAVSEPDSTYSFSDLSHLYAVMSQRSI